WTNVNSNYPYLSCFEVASRLHNVPLDVLLAVAATESNWDPDARSDANAHGIMQIQWPGTARHLGVTRVSELYNPCLNIELGARYLLQLMDDNGGNIERSLAAYNYGPTRIAALRQLPQGASEYVATVNEHRKRINATTRRKVGNAADRSPHARDVVRFDSSLRARRYARSIGKRVSNAEFTTQRVADGSYAVIMNVKAGGLSMGDLNALEKLGWPTLRQDIESGGD
ncbi:MAG: lytic transglycosylase domain-containing protein, partial [Gammaproteobacteria bacterium]|nr:lytic transglycosylase domain-containing protein [Gammaproteobacteria bacterium]